MITSEAKNVAEYRPSVLQRKSPVDMDINRAAEAMSDSRSKELTLLPCRMAVSGIPKQLEEESASYVKGPVHLAMSGQKKGARHVRVGGIRPDGAMSKEQCQHILLGAYHVLERQGNEGSACVRCLGYLVYGWCQQSPRPYDTRAKSTLTHPAGSREAWVLNQP